MKDKINYYPLQKLGYKDNLSITDQGVIIDTANYSQLQPNKKQQYKLTTKDGKIVYRAIKPLYRQAFGREFAEDSIISLEGEEWKQIDSYGKYYISNLGRVKSYAGRTARILKPYTNQKGYYRVDINLGCRRTYLVHQLVGLAFVPNDNPIEKDTIDHKDRNKGNNRADNLRWLSRIDNIKAYQEQKRGLDREREQP